MNAIKNYSWIQTNNFLIITRLLYQICTLCTTLYRPMWIIMYFRFYYLLSLKTMVHLIACHLRTLSVTASPMMIFLLLFPLLYRGCYILIRNVTFYNYILFFSPCILVQEDNQSIATLIRKIFIYLHVVWKKAYCFNEIRLFI